MFSFKTDLRGVGARRPWMAKPLLSPLRRAMSPLAAIARIAFSERRLGDDEAQQKRSYTLGLGALGALPVGLLVFAIGLSLGGTTGYAINPARDLGPRIAHALLPIPGKRDSDWGYAWVPVVAPIVGALIAALVARLIL